MADDCRGSSRTWQPPGASLYFKDSDRQGALLRELYATAVEATVLHRQRCIEYTATSSGSTRPIEAAS
jgi:hypothetical protein